MGGSWTALGGLLGRSWAFLGVPGALWGAPGALWGVFWASLGPLESPPGTIRTRRRFGVRSWADVWKMSRAKRLLFKSPPA
eukprot:7842075-Pyramimonas_sp.AAC.1